MLKSEIYDIGQNLGLKKGDIDKILLNITSFSSSELFLNEEIDDNFKKEIINKFSRLSFGEPIEYIINNAEFYSLDFYVDNRVLIPRNDTEIMVDKAIEIIIKTNFSTLIDIGTGSSCIPISIIKNTKKVKNCFVVDISRKALEVSNKNIIKHNLTKKIKQIKSNLLSKFLGTNDYEVTNNIIITANLPYIKDKDFENIDKETLIHEPNLALFGGKKTGFELYEKLIKECLLFKKLNDKKSVVLFIEIGFDQYEVSKEYIEKYGLNCIFYEDNNNIKRCVKITF